MQPDDNRPPVTNTNPFLTNIDDQTRIQIRLPNGTALTGTFLANDPLSLVKIFIEINRTDGVRGNFSMQTTFPSKIFTDEDMETTLEELHMVPSATIMVRKLNDPWYLQMEPPTAMPGKPDNEALQKNNNQQHRNWYDPEKTSNNWAPSLAAWKERNSSTPQHHFREKRNTDNIPCKYFLNNECRYGERCRYMHPANRQY